MKRYTPIILVGLAATGLNAANYEPFITQSDLTKAKTQAPAQPGDPDSAGSFRPGAGTVIVMELLKSLDVKKAKVGDQVEGTSRPDI